ncbi:MAG: ABC transporter permease [Anaerolineae bacterium]|nr:ABC transporter permease [Anaerolineae bacterium]
MIDVKRVFSRFRRTSAFVGFTLFLSVLVLNIVVQGPAQFFSARNMNTLFSKNMPLLLTTIAMAPLLISGTLDISIGIQLGLVNVVSIMVFQEWGVSLYVGFLMGILASLVVSALCWVLVSILRLPSMLASFSLIYIVRGVNVLIMNKPQGKVPEAFYKTYDSLIGGVVPFSALILLFVLLIWLYLMRTKFGRNIYAVGGNPRNAFAAGINPAWVQFQAFMIKGVVTGLAGICLTLMTASGNPLQGEAYGLRALSACIIGGLGFGGWGSMASAVFGAGFLVIIQNTVYYFFNLLYRFIPGFTVTSYWQNLVSDIIIFLGLLTTIVTAKGQREALKQGFVEQFKGGERVAE